MQNAASLCRKCIPLTHVIHDLDDQVAIVTGAGNGPALPRPRTRLPRRPCRRQRPKQRRRRQRSLDPAAQAVVDEITAAGGTPPSPTVTRWLRLRAGRRSRLLPTRPSAGSTSSSTTRASQRRRFKNMTFEQVDAVIAVHLGGAFNVTRAVWPVMRASRTTARIIQTTSGTGLFGNFDKRIMARQDGLVGMMHVLSIEGAP